MWKESALPCLLHRTLVSTLQGTALVPLHDHMTIILRTPGLRQDNSPSLAQLFQVGVYLIPRGRRSTATDGQVKPGHGLHGKSGPRLLGEWPGDPPHTLFSILPSKSLFDNSSSRLMVTVMLPSAERG